MRAYGRKKMSNQFVESLQLQEEQDGLKVPIHFLYNTIIFKGTGSRDEYMLRPIKLILTFCTFKLSGWFV